MVPNNVDVIQILNCGPKIYKYNSDSELLVFIPKLHQTLGTTSTLGFNSPQGTYSLANSHVRVAVSRQLQGY